MQKEAFYLASKGVKYGENGITVTTSRHSGKSYFLCESEENLWLLKEYNERIIANK